MNILWVGNYSSQSAYAGQGRLWVPRLRSLGHNVTVFELANGSGLPHRLPDGILILPTHLDPLGSDMLIAHARKVNADAVITLCDTWAFRPDIMSQVNWFPLTPIDHQPPPPAVVNSLKACKRPMAISRYGEQQLRSVSFDPFYWPHGIDPSIWHPGDKQEARKALGIKPDEFFVTFVGVNDSQPSRKGIPELLIAWSLFTPTHPDARLYMHTSDVGNLPANGGTGGVNIPVLAKTINLNMHTVTMVDQYRYKTGIPASDLASIARASDVLVLPSRGEGFGLPLVEFARCGCPTITSDFTAGAELCWGGWKIPGEPEWSWQNGLVQKPGIAALVEALEAAYAERDNPLRKQAQIEGARQYDVDTVLSRYAVPILRQMGELTLEGWKAA